MADKTFLPVKTVQAYLDPASNIKRQLTIVTGLMGYRYGDDAFHEWALTALSNALAAAGMGDIRELGVRTQTSPYCGITYREWFNTRTGQSLDSLGLRDYAIASNIPYVIQERFNRSVDDGTHQLVWCPQTVETCVEGECGTNVVDTPIDRNQRFPDDLLFAHLGRTSAGGGDWDVSVYAKFTDHGIPYFIPFKEKHTGSKDVFKQFLTMGAALGFAFIPGLQSAAAGAIFGSLAATYPALTLAATQAMVNSALNGGDVEAAVKSVAAGQLGAATGNLVQGVSDSEALGRLAASATRAAATGGDVESAVALTALQLAPGVVSDVADSFAGGFTSDPLPAPEAEILPAASAAVFDRGAPIVDVSDTLPTPESPAVSIFDIPTTAPTIDPSAASIDWDFNATWDAADWGLTADNIAALDPSALDAAALDPAKLDAAALDGSVPAQVPLLDDGAAPLDWVFQADFPSTTGADMSITDIPDTAPTLSDYGTVDYSSSGASESGASAGSSFFGNVSFSDVVSGVSNLAVAALRINQAYQSAGRPTVQPGVTTTSSGATQTARSSDGMLVITNPATGATSTVRPQVGMPYILPSGGVMTNNGDGTYTVIDGSGFAATKPYTAVSTSAVGGGSDSIVPGVDNRLLLGGGALLLLAVAMMRGGR